MDGSSEEYILRVLRQYSQIPSEEWDKLSPRLGHLHLEKNKLFVKQGDRTSRLAFITSGIFRVFCITESGNEKTLAFRTKGQLLAAYTPFLENRDSWYSIQALTESDLVCLSLGDFKSLSMGHPCWERIAKEYIVRLFIEKEDRERSFLVEDAKTRYLSFKEKYPDLERLIQQFHIASYLGISPVSLSRIRSELKKASH
jgi:CRP-like cAMP-binding protein